MAEATQSYHAFTVAVLARQVARNAVKRQLKERGFKLSQYSASEISLMAEAYIREHRSEVLADARERCTKLESDAQMEKARKSRASAVHMSRAKVEGGI